MTKAATVFTIAFLCTVSAAAEDWSGLVVPQNSTVPPGSNATFIGPQIRYIFRDASGGLNIDSAGFARLTDFARSSSVDSLNASVADLRSNLDALAIRQSHQLQRGIALAGALDLQTPIEGTSNRFGIGTAAYGSEVAVSFNYTHREGQFDFGAALSTTGNGAVLGKGSVGFNW